MSILKYLGIINIKATMSPVSQIGAIKPNSCLLMKTFLVLVASIGFQVSSGSAAAQIAPPVFVGKFSNTVQSNQSGDCSGISVFLWKSAARPKAETFNGILYRADGPCGGQAVPLINIIYSAKTHILRFDAPSPNFENGESLKFYGILSANSIRGKLTTISNGEVTPTANAEEVLLPLLISP